MPTSPAIAGSTNDATSTATVNVGGRTFRVLVALGTALATFLVIGLPTDIIPNPLFA